MNSAANNLRAVGQCLIEAKENDLVPHGQWQEWVLKNTGFSVKQAERMMQAAREVPEGSTLAQLSFTKIQACLMLPEADREPMAQRVKDENLTLRQLQAAVKQEREKNRTLEKAAKMAAEAQAQREAAAQAEIHSLNARLLAEQSRPNTGISPEAQKQIDALKADLDDAEGMVEKQSRLRQDAQKELLTLRAQLARGEAAEGCDSSALSPDDLAAAARTFIGRAALLPHMHRQLALANPDTRAAYQSSVDMIREWCNQAELALTLLSASEV